LIYLLDAAKIQHIFNNNKNTVRNMKTNNTNASLELARLLSETVNAAWESGELMDQRK